MADPKVYLNVPFAQKDAAKTLGARWDASLKKWYVPADKDITLFAQWQAQSGTREAIATTPIKNAASVDKAFSGVMTYAIDKNFVAYSGDEPPWD
ncbi:conserved hypothetical protein [Crenothrix polyspora]|jgi:hypothetical protein|uniref:DUF5710 domain-containing protein n=1 Tax=Crenothrix polyspora TaxID=360316 RepID=A0A1R4H1G8_9GAMM|nr:DUF5710 domain-containing protein [Crenothrix polyspora]SJM90071.1 conserved hypothetical protein [Crenothrix polyspora]